MSRNQGRKQKIRRLMAARGIGYARAAFEFDRQRSQSGPSAPHLSPTILPDISRLAAEMTKVQWMAKPLHDAIEQMRAMAVPKIEFGWLVTDSGRSPEEQEG